jgi:excisionase family DNA binding protein
MDEPLTFENLPRLVSKLHEEIRELKKTILNLENSFDVEQKEQLLNVKESAEFLNLSVSTIYTKVQKGEIPFMKRGKRLYFSSIELMAYLKEGRQATYDELIKVAEKY